MGIEYATIKDKQNTNCEDNRKKLAHFHDGFFHFVNIFTILEISDLARSWAKYVSCAAKLVALEYSFLTYISQHLPYKSSKTLATK